ncbi:GNAT family N-acetyltransferase [Mycolicibacterium sp. lyk4-40-TYG-92]|uniref:GNAT family N-acetyltransferase n=1 Tax=Mycolicibacterium sp. lyk4-40-TYG-92 TaxID=3040295 RepID=UPI00330679F5
MAVAQAHVRSWQVGYRGLLPIDYLDALRPEDRASRYGFDQMNAAGPFTQVAIDGGTVCGHVTTGWCRDTDLQGGGEIWALYVDPERWGSGIGRCLITAGCAQLSSHGYGTASLWVLSGMIALDAFTNAPGGTATAPSERTRLATMASTKSAISGRSEPPRLVCRDLRSRYESSVLRSSRPRNSRTGVTPCGSMSRRRKVCHWSQDIENVSAASGWWRRNSSALHPRV